MSRELDTLQTRIGYRFADKTSLQRALTHPSWLHDHPDAGGHNQRLEFLGDSVLQLVLSEALYSLFPDDREGELTKRRAVLGKGQFLSVLARDLNLDAYIRMSANEESMGGRNRDAALEDAFEALVGAVNLDGGFEAARNVTLRIYGDLRLRLDAMEAHANPKGRLQEIVQPEHGNNAVRYEVLSTEGADHERSYEVAVYLLERQLGSGRAPSKKAAEEEAARMAIAALRSDLASR
jgi:ribonuclease III